MSDETSPPFSGFRNARPARKTQEESEPTSFAAQQVAAVHEQAASRPRRARRTRAEIEATTRSPLTPTGELAVLKACLKQLRSLDDQARARTLVLLKAVFE